MRRLTLRKETLTELRVDELAAVVGADGATLSACVTDAFAATLSACISDRLAACDSILRPCITYTCTR